MSKAKELVVPEADRRLIGRLRAYAVEYDDEAVKNSGQPPFWRSTAASMTLRSAANRLEALTEQADKENS